MQKQQEYITDILTARQLPGDIFCIHVTKNQESVWVPLTWFLALVTRSNGSWQSLGTVYNPNPGIQCAQMSIYYIVPKESSFVQQYEEMIESLIVKARETNETD